MVRKPVGFLAAAGQGEQQVLDVQHADEALLGVEHRAAAELVAADLGEAGAGVCLSAAPPGGPGSGR
jgi:hypothetical protein